MSERAETDSQFPGREDAHRVTLLYLLLGSGWILLSDRAIHSWISSPALIEIASLAKGWLYVLVTTLLLNLLIHRMLDRVRQAHEQKQLALHQAHQERLQEQEKLRAHLEAMVERRTAELREAMAAAEAASAAKSALLASLGQEVSPPLDEILGTARLMRQPGLDARQSRQLDRLETAAGHLLTALDEVLERSRIEAGQPVLDKKPL